MSLMYEECSDSAIVSNNFNPLKVSLVLKRAEASLRIDYCYGAHTKFSLCLTFTKCYAAVFLKSAIDMTNNYKDTLNLPKTTFSMKANLAVREPGFLEEWQKSGLYEKIKSKNSKNPNFTLHDGPPYANGQIHVGHAVNKVLKDILLKSKTLSGFSLVYVPTWDCHGLPIELQVEKKHGRKVLLDANDFRKKCRQYAEKQVEMQKQDFMRLGVFAEWDKPYLTMQYSYEANIIRTLAKIVDNGHVKQGFKPVYWCSACRSSLAEAEVEYKDKTSPSIYVCFDVVDIDALATAFQIPSDNLKSATKVSVLIWTTTPWTLPANQAVAVSEDIQYALVKHSDEYFIVAKDLIASLSQQREDFSPETQALCQGKDLADLELHHPFYDKKVPILLGGHVTTDAGTGLVHSAPAHGEDDFKLCQRYKIETINPVDERGCYKDSTELFAGQFIFKANENVINVLRDKKNLWHLTDVNHSYPHCWRHKTPVIFRATSQWFICMEKQNLRKLAMDATEKVSWFPSWGKDRMQIMLENRPDWCISRQRLWGVPLVLFTNNETDEIHPKNSEIMRRVADVVEQNGVEAWFASNPSDFLDEADKDKYVATNDILDVWFDAGASHTCVLQQHEGLAYPADVYMEGTDQYRGWFQTALLSSLAAHNKIPYKNVVTHNFVVDADGHKMSKSVGNIIAPQEIVKNSGADTLRLWAALSDYRTEMTISQEVIKGVQDIYRRLRNTARFLLANLHDFEMNNVVADEELLEIDKWALARTNELQQEILTHYENYEFHVVCQKLQHFCVHDMGGFYLDVIKDRQYTMPQDSQARRSCQSAMYKIVIALAKWFAPILSFTAEDIWQHIPNVSEESVFLSNWSKDLPVLRETCKLNMQAWEVILKVRNEVNKAIEIKRNNGEIGSALEAEVTLYVNDEIKNILEILQGELHFIFISSSATLLAKKQATEQAHKTEVPGLSISIEKTQHNKCCRCWHRVTSVGQNEQHPELCTRCVGNIGDKAENRQFV